MDNYNSTACGDGLFGPSVWTEGCRGGFDFTCESITQSVRAIWLIIFSILSREYLEYRSIRPFSGNCWTTSFLSTQKPGQDQASRDLHAQACTNHRDESIYTY